MANSQATYTVFESDCPMLSDLELSETSLLRLDEEDDDQDDRTAILGWIMNENGKGLLEYELWGFEGIMQIFVFCVSFVFLFCVLYVLCIIVQVQKTNVHFLKFWQAFLGHFVKMSL